MDITGLIGCAVIVLIGSILVERVIIPFLSRRNLQKILKNKNNADPRCLENPKYGTVSGDVNCLKITWPKGDSATLKWDDIEEVHAYKIDLGTVDQIRLVFKEADTGLHYEINEEMAGYYDLLQDLPNHLPNFNMEWIFDVAFPAFETNHRIIWKRSSDKTAAVTLPVPQNS